MKIRPQTQITDNFFDNPLYVRELGLKHAVNTFDTPDVPGTVLRGKRSLSLAEIDEQIYKDIVVFLGKTYLNNSFNESKYESIQAVCEFQITDGTWTEGWVHVDKAFITSIIFLNPNPPRNTGTSVYKPIYSEIREPLHGVFQKKSNSCPSLRNTEEYRQKRKENNDQFIETIAVQNVFNRHVSFCNSQWHCGMNHFGDTDETSRLTIVTQIQSFGNSFIL